MRGRGFSYLKTTPAPQHYGSACGSGSHGGGLVAQEEAQDARSSYQKLNEDIHVFRGKTEEGAEHG